MGKLMEKHRKLDLGFVCNYVSELKLLLISLLILTAIVTLFQLIPSPFKISTSDLRFCISKISSPSFLTAPPSGNRSLSLPSGPSPPFGILKRAFNGYGSAAYSFVTMGAYRGGLNTFVIVGLSSKPLHVYRKPTYVCEWVSNTSSPVSISAKKFLPDWGFGRVYTVVVVNCTFENQINGDNFGGKLILHASETSLKISDEFEVLEEYPGSLNKSIFVAANPQYDYLYCGSSLYGNLSPQRVREWIAYHVRVFGEKSHFVIHDAGGIHEEVMEVLKPWMELGFVTLQDVKEQEKFDGYYHNQFLIVNDCLHRYKFMAKWIFFFDVDEYIYVTPNTSLSNLMESLSPYSQVTIQQIPINNKLCLTADNHKTHRKWGFEKLVYRDVKRGVRRDRKYFVQPRSILATGVHMSQNVVGKTMHQPQSNIKYYHYHGTISQRREPCRNLSNLTKLDFEKTPYVLDTTLREIASDVKKFELQMIGNRSINTRQ